MTESKRVYVNTAEALVTCHRALKSKNPKVQAAAESVLSALVVTLRHEKTALPIEINAHYELIKGE